MVNEYQNASITLVTTYGLATVAYNEHVATSSPLILMLLTAICDNEVMRRLRNKSPTSNDKVNVKSSAIAHDSI